MNLKDIAQGYLRQANLRLRTANNALLEKELAYSIRQAQECVELSLKAALNWVNIEYPHYHDVGPILADNKAAFPDWFQKKIERFSEISRDLARKR
ncbi:MAG: HEPN domain-containing protein, partial [Candidatus Ranarchaeia archaeon]